MYLSQSHISFFIAPQKMSIQFTLSFKNDFTLVFYNKINEFLTQTKCPIYTTCPAQHSTSLHFSVVTKKKILVNQVISILK